MNEQIFEMDIEEDFEILQQSSVIDPESKYFNGVVMALQQIVLNEEFEDIQNGFMKEYCVFFENSEENKIEYMQIFQKYQELIENYLKKALSQSVAEFNMEMFLELLKTRTNQIDEQILDMLMSLSVFQNFKELILDYKLSQQEEERHRVLTIKSNKIPENKKVKGSNNIFSTNPPLFLQGSNISDLKKSVKKSSKKQKTEEEIFVPDLVLTVRPLKKGQ